MPPDAEKLYSDAELDRIVAKRLKEQSDTLKAAGIDKELAAFGRTLKTLTRRVNDANHLKSTMVTKLEFQAAITSLNDRLSSLVTVEQLDADDFWVKAGVPHGLTSEEVQAVLAVAETAANQAQAAADRKKFHETLWGRATIVAGVVVCLMTIVQTALAFHRAFKG